MQDSIFYCSIYERVLIIVCFLILKILSFSLHVVSCLFQRRSCQEFRRIEAFIKRSAKPSNVLNICQRKLFTQNSIASTVLNNLISLTVLNFI